MQARACTHLDVHPRGITWGTQRMLPLCTCHCSGNRLLWVPTSSFVCEEASCCRKHALATPSLTRHTITVCICAGTSFRKEASPQLAFTRCISGRMARRYSTTKLLRMARREVFDSAYVFSTSTCMHLCVHVAKIRVIPDSLILIIKRYMYCPG